MSLFHAPGDWLSTRLTSRDRRSAIAWLLIADILSTPLQWPFRNSVSLVWMLSQVALAVGLGGMLSAETPVEPES
jgi:hypothetical protein